jgi:hypothetical protein
MLKITSTAVLLGLLATSPSWAQSDLSDRCYHYANEMVALGHRARAAKCQGNALTVNFPNDRTHTGTFNGRRFPGATAQRGPRTEPASTRHQRLEKPWTALRLTVIHF